MLLPKSNPVHLDLLTDLHRRNVEVLAESDRLASLERAHRDRLARLDRLAQPPTEQQARLASQAARWFRRAMTAVCSLGLVAAIMLGYWIITVVDHKELLESAWPLAMNMIFGPLAFWMAAYSCLNKIELRWVAAHAGGYEAVRGDEKLLSRLEHLDTLFQYNKRNSWTALYIERLDAQARAMTQSDRRRLMELYIAHSEHELADIETRYSQYSDQF